MLIQYRFILRWMVVMLITLGIASCGGSSSGGSSATPSVAITTINGVATKGPVKGGAVTVLDGAGSRIASAITDIYGNYTLAIPSNATLPLSIQVTGGIDQVTNLPLDMPLESVLTFLPTTGGIANANVLSTLVVGTARNLGIGGVVNTQSLQQAVGKVMTGLQGMGLPVAFNPISDAQVAGNSAEIIRANEAAGEMLRRVQMQMGGAATISSVTQQLSADLTDQVIDGYVDAAAVVATAQQPNAAFANNIQARRLEVETEVLANTLQLTNLGSGVRTAMDLQRVNAILQAVQSPYRTFSSIPVTQEQQNIIVQSAAVVNAIQTGSPTAALNSTISALTTTIQSQISVGKAVPASIQQQLDGYSQTVTQNLSNAVASGSSSLTSSAGVTVATQSTINSFKLQGTSFVLTDYYANGTQANYPNLPYSNAGGVLTLNLPPLNGTNANSIVQGTGGTSPVITLALASVPNGTGTIAVEVLLKTDASNGTAPSSVVNAGETSAIVTFTVQWSASGNTFKFISQPGIKIAYKQVTSNAIVSAAFTDAVKAASIFQSDATAKTINISLVNVFTSLPSVVNQLGLGSTVSGKHYFYQLKLPGLPLLDGNGSSVNSLQGSFAIQ